MVEVTFDAAAQLCFIYRIGRVEKMILKMKIQQQQFFQFLFGWNCSKKRPYKYRKISEI
jgi:hypothetical protein